MVRERSTRVQQVGIDEAYADLTGLDAPHAAAARARRRDPEAHRASASRSASAPNRLVAKIASDAEQARAASSSSAREQALRALRRLARPRLCPGIGPKTAERLAAMGCTTLGALQRAGEELLGGASARRWGRELRRARTSRTSRRSTTGARGEVRVARDDVRRRRRRPRRSSRRRSRRLAGELCAGLQRHGRRGRTIAIKVRLDDWTTVTRARTLDRRDERRRRRRADRRVELLRAYAPPRPVRLLGVRVAAFEDGDAPAPPAHRARRRRPARAAVCRLASWRTSRVARLASCLTCAAATASRCC